MIASLKNTPSALGDGLLKFSVEIISLQELLDTQGSPEKKIRFSPGTKLKPYKLGTPSRLFHSRKEEVNGTP